MGDKVAVLVAVAVAVAVFMWIFFCVVIGNEKQHGLFSAVFEKKIARIEKFFLEIRLTRFLFFW